MAKRKNILYTLVSAAAIVTGTICAANKCIAILAEKTKLPVEDEPMDFHWNLGNVKYVKMGTGTPLLLIHDLQTFGSRHEWDGIKEELSKYHTLYIPDLPGCGESDKPQITYTSFMYVNLLEQFVRKVIGGKCDVIASGLSTSFTIMACSNNPELFHKLMLITPPAFHDLNRKVTGLAKYKKALIESPILGTLIYNIRYSLCAIKYRLNKKYIVDNSLDPDKHQRQAYDAAHGNVAGSKALEASINGGYMNCNILGGCKKIDNDVCLIGGENAPGILVNMSEYLKLNLAFEYELISKANIYPHIENPKELMKEIHLMFNH